jgi:hypothetical protein
MLKFVSLLFLFTITLHAQTTGRATVAGSVLDDSGAPIPGVTVTATRQQGEATVSVTNSQGDFRIDELAPGAYTIEALLDGFQPVQSRVKLTTGQKLQVAFKPVPAFGEIVEVTAEAAATGEVAILESRRQALVVSDSISAEEIRRTPDSSAAGVVERLTGVTLLGDKYVFVRGLGERYSGTTINGSTLPTTETEKRVVPLDLFPARLLDTVNVVKTYTPDKPGDFGSGVVEMTTTQFPSAATMKLTLGSAHNSGATGESFRRYAGGLDRWGRGGQPIPSAMPADFLKRRSLLDPTGYTPQELETFGETLAGNWTGDPVGGVKVTSGQNVLATARVINDLRGEAKGTAGFAFDAEEVAETGGTMPFLVNNADYRTNIGYFNPSASPVTATFVARRTSDGAALGSNTLTIPGFAMLQQAAFGLLSSVPDASRGLNDFYVSWTSTAPLFVYASVTDNKTGDAVLTR